MSCIQTSVFLVWNYELFLFFSLSKNILGCPRKYFWFFWSISRKFVQNLKIFSLEATNIKKNRLRPAKINVFEVILVQNAQKNGRKFRSFVKSKKNTEFLTLTVLRLIKYHAPLGSHTRRGFHRSLFCDGHWKMLACRDLWPSPKSPSSSINRPELNYSNVFLILMAHLVSFFRRRQCYSM